MAITIQMSLESMAIGILFRSKSLLVGIPNCVIVHKYMYMFYVILLKSFVGKGCLTKE